MIEEGRNYKDSWNHVAVQKQNEPLPHPKALCS